MTVGIKVGSIVDEIGTADFLHAFFSTVSGRLEDKWAARFPSTMQLYNGNLPFEQASSALAELADIRLELASFLPSHVIWDIKDRTKVPPWGIDISPVIKDLSDYFVTSTGRDLIGVLQEALQASHDEKKSAEIVRY